MEKHMPLTRIFIRCHNDSPRVFELIKQLRAANPDLEVVAVPDCTSRDSSGLIHQFESDHVRTLPITQEFLSSQGLSFAGHQTGWLCGDYVFLRAFEIDWDYAWIIEPDVYLFNGTESLFTTYANNNEDLLATGIKIAPTGWVWEKRLRDVGFDQDIYCMQFPLVRISRKLALEVLETRRSIGLILGENPSPFAVPNDESIVASLANQDEFSSLDLEQINPQWFQNWSTDIKILLSDVTDSKHPQIIHSGQNYDDYFAFIDWAISESLKGSKACQRKLLAHAAKASHETTNLILERLLNAVIPK